MKVICYFKLTMFSLFLQTVKKKRRLSQGSQVFLLVLGTDAGQIHFFSIAESGIVASLNGHNRPVTAITASPGTDLYSAAGNIVVRWNIFDKTIKRLVLMV